MFVTFDVFWCFSQREVGRNRELCVVICRLEEREAEQVESIHQLKLKVDELQKHLEQKDHSLSKAYEVCQVKLELC